MLSPSNFHTLLLRRWLGALSSLLVLFPLTCQRAPQFVRREDWVHTLWPPEETAKWTAVNRGQSQRTRGRPPLAANARENSVTTDKQGNERSVIRVDSFSKFSPLQ